MNPKLGRTAEQRKGKKGKGTGKDDQAADEQEELEARATRLCFILKLDRGDDDPVDLADEAFVAHKCRFLTLAQFATYVDFAILQKNQPPPVIIGWNDKQCQPEGSAENILKDLVSFARLNWPDAANEFGHSLKVIEGTHKKVSAVSRKSTANQNLRSGFFPVDQAEHKAKKGKGKGKAPAARLTALPITSTAHQWRMVPKPSEGKGAAGSSSDAVVGPPERTIAQDIAMKGAAKAKGKGKSDTQPKGKGKYEPQKGQYKSEPYKGHGKEKGKEKGKGKPAQERVYYGDREWFPKELLHLLTQSYHFPTQSRLFIEVNIIAKAMELHLLNHLCKIKERAPNQVQESLRAELRTYVQDPSHQSLCLLRHRMSPIAAAKLLGLLMGEPRVPDPQRYNLPLYTVLPNREMICTYQPPYQPPEGGNDDLPVWEEKALGLVPYSDRWAEELAKIMVQKNPTSHADFDKTETPYVRTEGGRGQSISFVADGQPGELSRTPTREDFPLVVISKKLEAPAWHKEFRRELPNDPLLHTDVYKVKAEFVGVKVLYLPDILKLKVVSILSMVWNNWDNMKVFSKIPIRAVVLGVPSQWCQTKLSHSLRFMRQECGIVMRTFGALACFGPQYCDLARFPPNNLQNTSESWQSWHILAIYRAGPHAKKILASSFWNTHGQTGLVKHHMVLTVSLFADSSFPGTFNG
ncbi:Hypothetical protein (Fragment) [Durusdinium trenchii]|uniref:Uncharacterized protein n=1 Tax=Durusdinium trenchii TaxID=1381693 RepID=A0ABP0Q773_9DINO